MKLVTGDILWTLLTHAPCGKEKIARCISITDKRPTRSIRQLRENVEYWLQKLYLLERCNSMRNVQGQFYGETVEFYFFAYPLRYCWMKQEIISRKRSFTECSASLFHAGKLKFSVSVLWLRDRNTGRKIQITQSRGWHEVFVVGFCIGRLHLD
jgi:hypothetical protein